MKRMISVQLADTTDPEISATVWQLVKMCDEEFVPPLRSRDSTIAGHLSTSLTGSEEPVSYFDMLKSQHLLIARFSPSVVGFLSFRHDHVAAEWAGFPSNYITTICVHKDHRRKGVGAALYRTILERLPDALTSHYTTTRTWDGNEGHIQLLRSMGFQLVRHVVNDRGGGIGSSYWVKGAVA
ncbi:GNAT family N-acetyltransferase [candidate division KSB1 bacterium]|nr:GNAT family N-acetyltransferase [candidate division KSB1 bacterium]